MLQAEFEPGQPDIRLTLNLPSFRLTLWQNGKEVKSYYIGVGMKNHPLYIGDHVAREHLEPNRTPPPSDWVVKKWDHTRGTIKAEPNRNPREHEDSAGGPYLIHQATGTNDVGNLVSHGCVRMLRAELYELADRIIAARTVPVSRKRIEAAKRKVRRPSSTGSANSRGHQLRHARGGEMTLHLSGRLMLLCLTGRGICAASWKHQASTRHGSTTKR